jgi:hypothetical protein
MTSLDTARSAEARPGGASPARRWAATGFVLALLLTAVAILGQGLGRAGLGLGLRLTARLAFPPFWLCYTAGSLVVLFGPAFTPVKRHARELGLTFASILAVHLGLVAAVSAIGAAPAARVFMRFGPGAACAGLLAIASNDKVGRAIGPAGWWMLRNLAMNYLLFDFAVDFVHRAAPRSLIEAVAYLPFAGLTILAPGLRMAAWTKRRLHRTG